MMKAAPNIAFFQKKYEVSVCIGVVVSYETPRLLRSKIWHYRILFQLLVPSYGSHSRLLADL